MPFLAGEMPYHLQTTKFEIEVSYPLKHFFAAMRLKSFWEVITQVKVDFILDLSHAKSFDKS